jgi:hypothetical protein
MKNQHSGFVQNICYMNTLLNYIFSPSFICIELGNHVFLSLVLFNLKVKLPLFRFNHFVLLIEIKSIYLYELIKNATIVDFSKFSESENKLNSVINNSKTYEISLINLDPSFGLV